MQTVRRLYLYLLSGISLGVLSTGAWFALRVLLDSLGIGHGGQLGGPNINREQLTVALSLIGVGLPVWGIHWWLAERGVRGTSSGHDAERGSTLRALYLSAVLAASFGFGAFAAVDLVRELVLAVGGGRSFGEFDSFDLAGSLAALVISGSVWGYHLSVRRRDLDGSALVAAAAWLPRVYLYGVALIALQLVFLGAADLVRIVADALLSSSSVVADDQFRRAMLAGGVSTVVVGGAAWLGHWWYARRLLADPGWRGASERPARMRVAYFVVVVLASAALVVGHLADVVRAVLGPTLEADRIVLLGGTSVDLAREVFVALGAAALPALAWWQHQRWMRAEADERDQFGAGPAAERLDRYAVALVGLGYAAFGLAWLLGLLIDVTLGGTRTSTGDGFWRVEFANFAGFALAGSVPWLWEWSRTVSRLAADPNAESGSTVRRTYLLIALAGAVIAGISSLGVILYRLFGSLLGVSLGGNPVSELSTPTGFLVLALAIGTYHGLAARADQARREAAPAAPDALAGAQAAVEAMAAAAPAAAAPAAAAPGGRMLVLSGPPGEDLTAAIDGLRNALPQGYRLDDG